MLTLAVLVGDVDEIVASHTSYKWDAPTVWSTWAFTKTGLAHVKAKFEPESYDAAEDRQRRQRGSEHRPAEPTALTAWIRPLHTVTALEIRSVHYSSWADPFESHEDFTPLEIVVDFDDVSERIAIELAPDDQSSRQRWLDFVVAAQRAAAGANPVRAN